MTVRATVSVIIPAWNAASTLALALRSALDQTRQPDEIVVVDDGSTDSTADLIVTFRDSRIRLIRQEHAGPIVARNRAIGATSGSLIAPLDADDVWHPAYLADMAGALNEGAGGSGFAYAFHRQIDAENRLLRDGPSYRAHGMALHRHLLFNFVGNGSSAVFHRGALIEAGGYDQRCTRWGGAEDYLLQLRVAARFPVTCVPRWLVGYRRAVGSYSSNAAKAHSARLNAVETVLNEISTPWRSRIERWTAGDSARVLSVQMAAAGKVGAGLVWGLRAAARDPAGTAAEGAARARNALTRAGRRNAEAPVFADLEPDKGFAPALDRMLKHRLTELAIADGTMCAGRVPDGVTMVTTAGEA